MVVQRLGQGAFTAVAKIQSLVGELRFHKPCKKKKRNFGPQVGLSSPEPTPCLHTWGNRDPREGEVLLGISSSRSRLPRSLEAQGGIGIPASCAPPPQHCNAPWLSAGSQKHFFSSGKQLQIPKPALIPRRSPGSCPPMMLPPPEDRHHPLSSPLSASRGTWPARTTRQDHERPLPT